MSYPPPEPFVPYPTAVPSPYDGRDEEHLRILAIMHYVLGGMEILFSSFALVYVAIGAAMLSGGDPMGFKSGPNAAQPPPFVGWMFIGMGSGCTAGGWAIGLMTIVAGRRMAHLRSRTFAMVVAGINCLWVPFGTVLGVFTFIVLGRESVRLMFAEAKGSV